MVAERQRKKAVKGGVKKQGEGTDGWEKEGNMQYWNAEAEI